MFVVVAAVVVGEDRNTKCTSLRGIVKVYYLRGSLSRHVASRWQRIKFFAVHPLNFNYGELASGR